MRDDTRTAKPLVPCRARGHFLRRSREACMTHSGAGDFGAYNDGRPHVFDPAHVRVPGLEELGQGELEGLTREEAVARLAPGDPDRAARLAPLIWNARDEWVIDGHRFSPIGLVPYDPALAEEIKASIRQYLEEQ